MKKIVDKLKEFYNEIIVKKSFIMGFAIILFLAHVLYFPYIRVDDISIILLIILIILLYIDDIKSIKYGDFEIEKFANKHEFFTEYDNDLSNSISIESYKIHNKTLISLNNDLIDLSNNKVLASKIVFNTKKCIDILKSKNISSITDVGNDEFKINFIVPQYEYYEVIFTGNSPISASVIEANKNFVHFKLTNNIPEIVSVTIKKF